MPKQEARVDANHPNKSTWQSVWMTILFAVITAGLSVFVWIITLRAGNTASLGVFLSLMVVPVILVVAAERAMTALSMSRRLRYRLAFLYSVGLFTLLLVYYCAQTSFSGCIFLFVVILLGSFAGGLLVTGIDEKLWEDNSPPAQSIQSEVYQRHLTIIGEPGRAPLPKRLFDISLALFGLVISVLVWLLSAFLIWFEDPGPILFVKNSVGKGGRNFRQYKFRTMVLGAEEHSGPVLASAGDERVLKIGRLLRKTALDELPQLINILSGDMSFVGPRPQRTVLVRGYLERMPEYCERHRVLPGLSGLAQVAGDYYLTPRQKLRFDRIYIRHSSLGFDLKLICLAFLITFWYRWQKEWNGRLPRWMIRFGYTRGD